MGPRGNSLWEFWSLCFWWAAWSLADTYLLPFTPFAELGTLGVCFLAAWICRSRGRILASQRYAAQHDESGDAAPSKPAVADAV